MSLTPAITRTEDGSWDLTWPVGTTPYSVYLDGELLTDSLTTEAYTVSDPRYVDDAPPVEIVSAGETAQSTSYPPKVVIQWRGLQAADGYEVQEWDGSAWVTVGTLEEVGAGYYTWESDALSDVTTHQHRVRAFSHAGQNGVAIAFDSFVVRTPPPPSVALSIDGSGDVAVASG